MLSLMLWNSTRVINDYYSEFVEKAIQEESDLIAAAITPGLIVHDVATIEDVLALAHKNNDLSYAEIFDYSGQLIASVGKQHKNLPLSDLDKIGITQNNDFIEVTRRIIIVGQDMGFLRTVYSKESLHRILNEVQIQNTIIAGITLLLLIIATIFISIILTKKLRILSDGVKQIQQGNLEHIITMDNKDDFGELASAFNEMSQHLESTQNRLQKEHHELTRQTAHLKSLLNNVDAVIWESEETINQLTFVSREAEYLLGYPVNDWFKSDFLKKIIHFDDYLLLKKRLKVLNKPGSQASVDIRMIHKIDKPVWTRLIASSDYDPYTGKNMIRGIIVDISQEKRREEQIIYLAEHDALTGLYNRRYFLERLNHHISFGERYGHLSSLLFIDLDQFKFINDSYGHKAGDTYLIQVAKELSLALRDTDILGRLGGDEFGVILPFTNQDEAVQVTENILASLTSHDWSYEGNTVHISASIGITLFPGETRAAEQVLAEADTAMYSAKNTGRNQYHIYDKNDSGMERMLAKVEIETMIRDALKNNKMVLHFQPIYTLKTGEISHHEALVRIIDDNNKLIMPGSFIKMAERFGLIKEIDQWVFNSAINLITQSLKQGEKIDIAINLSGKHIDNTGFHKWMHKLLAKNKNAAKHIIIELTETAAVESLATAKTFIESMKQMGCRFALDDFGVGFSSFHYIKNLPVDYIKIDGSFVKNLHLDEADKVFVQATVDIAKSMGIQTIAEYVENAKIMNILRELGADYGQGFYLAEPDVELSRKPIDIESYPPSLHKT